MIYSVKFNIRYAIIIANYLLYKSLCGRVVKGVGHLDHV